MKYIKPGLLCVLLLLSLQLFSYEKPIVVLITSYNNERWVEKNLNSVYMQKYENYRVIYVDDCSSDKTYERVLQSVREHNKQYKFTVIRNSERRNAMANFYTSIHMCKDEEIVVTLDGDDWFAHDHVLAYINNVYSDPKIWVTYGRYQILSSPTAHDHNEDFPQDVIEHNKFRGRSDFPVSHLRTHYAWIFKLIKLEDFLYEDYYFPMTSDYAMFLPTIEMSSLGHFLPVHEILYIYNNHNPINDSKVNQRLQRALSNYILNKQAYIPLQEPLSVETPEQNDHVSMIAMGASYSKEAELHAGYEHVKGLYAACALVPEGSSSEMTGANITSFPYSKNTFLATLRSSLAACKSNYVLLCTDNYEFISDLDLQLCVSLLKKTHTDIFYCGLSYDHEARQLFNRPRLPLVSQEFPVYAWHANNRKGQWLAPVLDMTIWKKAALQKILDAIDAQTLQDVKVAVDRCVQQNNLLGLMFKNRICTCKVLEKTKK
jgi:glycosyltransferase involved in cell wall biosynthesis